MLCGNEREVPICGISSVPAPTFHELIRIVELRQRTKRQSGNTFALLYISKLNIQRFMIFLILGVKDYGGIRVYLLLEFSTLMEISSMLRDCDELPLKTGCTAFIPICPCIHLCNINFPKPPATQIMKRNNFHKSARINTSCAARLY